MINDGAEEHSIPLKDVPIFLKKNLYNVKKSTCIKTKNLWLDDEEKCYRYYVLLFITLILYTVLSNDKKNYIAYLFKLFKI